MQQLRIVDDATRTQDATRIPDTENMRDHLSSDALECAHVCPAWAQSGHIRGAVVKSLCRKCGERNGGQGEN